MTDRELIQKALVHMGINQHAVADQAPHRDVMAYNETMEELRAALEQQAEPVALIRDGVLCWHIPNPHYSRPAWTAHGTHMLYVQPPQRTPLTDAEIEATFLNCNGKWDGDQWVIEDADFHPFARAIEQAHGIKGEA